MNGLGIRSGWLVVSAAGLAAATTASADIALTVEANSDLGTGIFQVSTDDGVTLPDGTFLWTLDAPVDLVDTGTGNTVATLSFGTIMLGSTGVVSHSFVVDAAGSDTHFTLGSGLVNVGPYANPLGRASAGMSLTDGNGNGATLTGNFAGGTLFNSFYDGGASFANLLAGPYTAGSFGSFADNDEYPAGAGNFAAFAGPASEIGIGWDFILSANDSASGTSVFTVIPTPAAGLTMLVGAGLLASRRRS
ncbi:MAG: hypothetical protein D6695_06955 [Planctomycetota bacterium]|nr:MAG: hypothetical protein D6695_06955 [Planctomycetota bacterium]